MEIQHLDLLRELADRGSVTAVAAAVHRSPSAVSQQLRTLQRQLGVELVRRSGRGVQLTDAGLVLARASVAVSTAAAEAEAALEAHRGGRVGVVRLALFPSAVELLLPGLLVRMREHAGIELEISDRDVSEDEFAQLTADVDVVIGHRSDGVVPVEHPGLTVVPLLREPLEVALPLDHPLAGRERVTVADVIGEPWVGVPEGYPIDRVLVSMALQSGVVPRVVHRTVHLPVIEAMVAAGLGIALVPRHTSAGRAPGRFRLATLDSVQAGRHVEALMRPERAARPVVQTVVAEIAAEARATEAASEEARRAS
ncbi:LysR family transcriptional regulator [Frigoribacterium sp. CFBP 8766]|uniref:LysR family transcriptional regulator n=1 Tax=Frigoribacterium sp. CFBP 8766 TaxID=2775273 RepID=UPI00177BF815|nr:LysR family transcriptional regulator [Frigoribacterium sp. CFBP 8766]MBD8585738.1 LysR family transcriptional regulator [Frigoribacterium sp. CFBP 8766]